ncbi:MAG: ABC transporter ATP-binding protein [Candidatus Bathyarchaeia archaeon]
MDMEYAIETVNLVKRYPTTSKRDVIGIPRGPAARGTVGSINAILEAIKGSRGPFIEALKNVNLGIREGEIFGILGPNGAGKTTLIKILCTLVIHDEGEVYVNGFDPKRESGEVLKNLQAVLPESRGFNWRLSGRQNLEFYALLYGLGDAEAKKRISYLLDFTDLTDRADDGYQRYSTGMQRKLLLCRALLRNTPIIVFDEPTAGLDPTSADEFRRMIIDRLARKEGKTILMSTHNLQEAQELCDRLAILERGKVIALDTPDNVRHLVIEDRFLRIVFADALFGAEEERLVRDLEAAERVCSVSAEVDQGKRFCGLTMRVEKDLDLAGILKILAESGLRIRAVNIEEPTLEDAFNAITGQDGRHERSRREGGGQPWRSR